MTTQLKIGETLLFIGDSITDAERRTSRNPLGDGYVRAFNDLLIVREPDKRVLIMNRGIAGNTIDDLRNRWFDDVLRHRPDWLSILIGINDIHDYVRNPAAAAHLAPEAFAGIYRELLTFTRDTLPRTQVLLITPYYLSSDMTANAFRAKILRILPDYLSQVRRLAFQFNLRLVDMQRVFQARLALHHPDMYSEDAVHLNSVGALLLAEQVYLALESAAPSNVSDTSFR